MRSTRTVSSSRRFFMRSWVMGRAVMMPWSANAMAVASMAPIQIGRNRSPSVSFSRTMGWLVGSSTRTPTRFISIIAADPPPCSPSPSSCHPRRLGVEERHQGVRVLLQRREVHDLKDIREVPVALPEVQAVAHHEPVRYQGFECPDRFVVGYGL